MSRRAVLLTVCATLAAGAGAGAGVEVLAPAPGTRLPAAGAWLVLRAPAPPAVRVGGAELAPRVREGEVYHYRLGSPTQRVEAGGRELTLGGGAGGFHGTGAAACWECHDGGDAGCGECHPVPGESKHRAVLAAGCVGCHAGPGRAAPGVAERCLGCHPEYGGDRHGRVRHAVASERDPLRPGRAMDCASCHDPHAPRCLSCLPRSELRGWCKRCHGGP